MRKILRGIRLVEDFLRPTTEVTRAIAAVAKGNLTQTVRLGVDGRPLEGELLRPAKIVNTMIQQLVAFTAEVTRVAREVGTDDKLDGQAQVPEPRILAQWSRSRFRLLPRRRTFT
jgi:methyl-accepting chemotaxis protein